MDSAKQQLTDKLKTANNILVTVSRNPSVDQLASCIGLTLLLNKQGKHAAAVFSGAVPSTIEFLQPAETLEKNTDSLRDFIIALDKSKADKLRYKVEDNIVRIFITPYKTSISEADLEFSEGDFNVDVVVAIGVRQQEDLDEAITAHGRILHDATLTSINTAPDGGLGTINWHDPQASSLSELVTELAAVLGENLLDNQIATALLTGIVSETDRFSNDKTSSQTMNASAALMAAGANQQLVASKLEESASPSSPDQSGNSNGENQDQSSDQKSKQDDGAIQINHNDETPLQDEAINIAAKEPSPILPTPSTGDLPPTNGSAAQSTNISSGAKLMTEPPTLGGTLNANSKQEEFDPANDPLGFPSAEPPQLLDHQTQTNAPASSAPPGVPTVPPAAPIPQPVSPPQTASSGFTPPPATWWVPPPPTSPSTLPAGPPASNKPADIDRPTLAELEDSVGSPHIGSGSRPTLAELEDSVGSQHIDAESKSLDVARNEVNRALSEAESTTSTPHPIQALNAQQFGGDLHPTTTDNSAAPAPQTTDTNAPPPVPPPIPFQFGNPPQAQ